MLSTRRLILLAVVIGLAITMAVARAIQIQVVESPKYAAAANFQQTETHTSLAPRGGIYDRSGNVLAVSNRTYLVRINPRTITDTLVFANALSPALARSPADIQHQIQSIIDSTSTPTPTSTIVAVNLAPAVTDVLTQTLFGFDGLQIEETWQRIYPQGPIAGPTLGFVSLQPTGYSGIEGFYNARLSAEMGERKQVSRLNLVSVKPKHDGADVVLTLDLTLQNYVEKRLAQAIQDTQAVSGTIIVMESKTGAILASASTPGYDPNRALDIANTGQFSLLKDPAASELYEPGSVLKVATIATALDLGQVTTSTLMTDTGRLIISGRRIYNSDRTAHGIVDIEDILARSLNVPTAQLALQMGPERFYERFSLFGFGSKTGIDLGDEQAGVLRTPSDIEWSQTDLATNSYGQGMSATPYQVINALNAIANDGVLMQPYIVKEWRDADGTVTRQNPVATRRVISAQTARTLRDVMVIATRRGTPDAMIQGYTIAGKTGTADWFLRKKINDQWVIEKQDTTIVTYVGFLPADDPKITVLVKLDQPKSSKWAGETTVPVFRDVAERACQIVGVPPNVVK
jgi:cell division protein FtsI/penicillin-binding protein 2